MKKINMFNFAMLALLIVADIWFIVGGTLLSKTIASLIFVAIGFVNLIYLLKRKKVKNFSAYLMFVGLCVACLGDVFLEINFIVGAIFFAIGHIFYFVSYCFIEKFNLKDLIYGAAIFIPSLCVILFVPIFNFGDVVMQVLCCVYALVISLMVGKAASNFFKKKSILNIIILIGSVLFFFSDLMLLFNNFANIDGIFLTLCLVTYYPAEFLLAYSILKHNNK